MIFDMADWLLAAQGPRWRHMGDRFSGEHAKFSSLEVLLVLGGGALFVLTIVLLHRAALNSHGHFAFASNSSRRLFGELCRAHRLRFSSRRLLKRLAKRHQIPSPAVLFVEPEWFEPGKLPVELTEKAVELEQLRLKLFGASNSAKGEAATRTVGQTS